MSQKYFFIEKLKTKLLGSYKLSDQKITILEIFQLKELSWSQNEWSDSCFDKQLTRSFAKKSFKLYMFVKDLFTKKRIFFLSYRFSDESKSKESILIACNNHK